MAGYTRLHPTDPWYIFRVGDPDLDKNIRETNQNVPDIILLLNNDELDAALWGLENYQKGTKVTIKHDRDCPCTVEFCHVHPGLVKTGV